MTVTVTAAALVPFVNTDKGSYKACGVIYYKVRTFSATDVLLNAGILVNFIDPNSVVQSSTSVTTGNNGTGVFTSIFQLPQGAVTGGWNLKSIYQCSGGVNITAAKQFTVT